MGTNNEIKLVQRPVIAHELVRIGKSVSKRLEDLNIENTIATTDTVKALKDLRATLNKELADFESQRKFLKEGVMNPYNEFEAIYKTEISEKYKSATDTLKDKIAIVEDKIKQDKKEAVKSYFVELCLSEDIDFICFDQVGLEINLSTTEKAYKEKCNEFIQKIVDDILLIETQEFKAEISVEYKKTLNASRSIKEVQDRKEKVRLETLRIKLAETNRRKAVIYAMGMIYDSMLSLWDYASSDIHITQSDLENLTVIEFSNKVISLEEAIKAVKAQVTAIIFEPELTLGAVLQEIAKPIIQQTITTPLHAPIIEAKPEVVTASFSVTGTFAQLKALGQYMKSIPLIYKNI